MAIATAHHHSALRDLGLLLARIVLGVIFIAHGWENVTGHGPGTVDAYRGMGVPLPQLMAPLVAWVHFLGGIALILGVFTPIVGVVLAITMLVAALLVHIPHGVFIEKGGWELTGALGAAALALAASGAGRFALDHLLVGRRRASGRRRGHPAAAGSSAAA